MARDELLPLVNSRGETIGSAMRSDVHRNPTLLHPVVHCLVTNYRAELLLQLRGQHKDVQPGRWDTSVGGHVGFGESIEAAVVREIHEELGVGVSFSQLDYLYRYVMQSEVETELVHSFRLASDGPFRLEAGEIEALRFWTRDAIEAKMGGTTFTPNFEDEYRRYQRWLAAASRVRD
jgi:isopentenyldiphosphate isomerase